MKGKEKLSQRITIRLTEDDLYKIDHLQQITESKTRSEGIRSVLNAVYDRLRN